MQRIHGFHSKESRLIIQVSKKISVIHHIKSLKKNPMIMSICGEKLLTKIQYLLFLIKNKNSQIIRDKELPHLDLKKKKNDYEEHIH